MSLAQWLASDVSVPIETSSGAAAATLTVVEPNPEAVPLETVTVDVIVPEDG